MFAEMHVFADFNHEEYSVVSCYGCFTYNNGKIVDAFLFEKCKIFLFGDTLSFLHLELVAAVMATRISKSIVQESNIVFEHTIYWSDSLPTLHLICNHTRRFCVFVDARLAEIRDSSLVSDWRYCPSNQNPVDVGTRVIMPKNTKKFSPWFKGPFLIII